MARSQTTQRQTRKGSKKLTDDDRATQIARFLGPEAAKDIANVNVVVTSRGMSSVIRGPVRSVYQDWLVLSVNRNCQKGLGRSVKRGLCPSVG